MHSRMVRASLRSMAFLVARQQTHQGVCGLSTGMVRDPHASTVLAPTEPIEHGGMPDVMLQPVRKHLGSLLYDFFELLCGPLASDGSLPADPMASIKWAPAVTKGTEIYGREDEDE